MLFDGLACFSPSVPAFVRKAWVSNGGKLTQTVQDFYEAQYFFCNGLDDPWLATLLSKSLIVRHALWVIKSVENSFLIPIAGYTLDDVSNPQRIELQGISEISVPHDVKSLTDEKLNLIERQIINPSPSVVRNKISKRGYETDESDFSIERRPRKKARLDADAIELEDEAKVVEEIVMPFHIEIVDKCSPYQSMCKKLLSQTEKWNPPVLLEDESTAPCEEYAPWANRFGTSGTFNYTNILGQGSSKEPNKLNISVRTLLQAPSVKAKIFVANVTCFNKEFSVKPKS